MQHPILGFALTLINTAKAGVVGHVADVGDVLNQSNLDFSEFGGAANQVGEQKSAHIAHMGIAVDGGTTGIDPQESGLGRDDRNHRAVHGVVQAHVSSAT